MRGSKAGRSQALIWECHEAPPFERGRPSGSASRHSRISASSAIVVDLQGGAVEPRLEYRLRFHHAGTGGPSMRSPGIGGPSIKSPGTGSPSRRQVINRLSLPGLVRNRRSPDRRIGDRRPSIRGIGPRRMVYRRSLRRRVGPRVVMNRRAFDTSRRVPSVRLITRNYHVRPLTRRNRRRRNRDRRSLGRRNRRRGDGDQRPRAWWNIEKPSRARRDGDRLTFARGNRDRSTLDETLRLARPRAPDRRTLDKACRLAPGRCGRIGGPSTNTGGGTPTKIETGSDQSPSPTAFRARTRTS